MSTYVYLQCLDHNPPLRARDESGQHLYDLPRIRAEVAHRSELVALIDEDRLPEYYTTGVVGHYFQSNSARFLAEHAQCRIGIVDEYGEEHPIEAVS